MRLKSISADDIKKSVFKDMTKKDFMTMVSEMDINHKKIKDANEFFKVVNEKLLEKDNSYQEFKAKQHKNPIHLKKKERQNIIEVSFTPENMTSIAILNRVSEQKGGYFQKQLPIFLAHVRTVYGLIVKQKIKNNGMMKVFATLVGEFKKPTQNKKEKLFVTTKGNYVVTHPNQVDSVLKSITAELEAGLSEMEARESGWALSSIKRFDFQMIRHSYAKGAKYIPLPDKIKNAKCCINVHNEDDRCFVWSVLAGLYYEQVVADGQNQLRVSSYKRFEEMLKVPEFQHFPVHINDIKKFEELNNLKINVFEYEAKSDSLMIQYRGLATTYRKEIDLLLISQEGAFHYVYIRNFTTLMNIFNRSASHHRSKFYCKNCLNKHFYNAQDLKEHEVLCEKNEFQVVKMCAEEQKKIKFKNFAHKIQVPFVIYADFEAITEKLTEKTDEDEETKNTEEDALAKSSTTPYQKHKLVSYGFQVVSQTGETYDYQTGVLKGSDDADIAERFLKKLQFTVRQLLKTIDKKMEMTDSDTRDFEKADTCHICKKKFINGEKKVRDHCHATGKYRGAAHNLCNANFRISKKVSVFFHNLKGYDSHFIVQAMTKLKNEERKYEPKIDLIPLNHEKFLSFTLDNNIVFKDTLNFIQGSLEKLVELTPRSEFHCFNRAFSNYTDVQKALLLRKGVFPYDWFDSIEKFDETQLPPIEDFYSRLYEKNITDEDYLHAKKVWSAFNLKNFKQYHDLYLKTDVVLLADVFECFRKNSYQYYGLDVAHYYTLPGYAWDAMLLKNYDEDNDFYIENFTDLDKHLFVEQSIRGGISVITHKHSKANNKYMGEKYNKNEESKYIIYLDMNNLYGMAMVQPLPYQGYEWVEVEDWTVEKLLALSDGLCPSKGELDSPTQGFIFEVDIHYPDYLHDSHNDYPFVIENRTGIESPYTQKVKKDAELDTVPTPKLIPHLGSKKKYVVHYRFLQQMVRNGLEITKFHRCLTFKQAPILKSFIEFNTNMRKKATTDIEKDLFKLMNNAIYGKTFENVRNRCDIQLVNKDDDKAFENLAHHHYVKGFKKINETTYSIEKAKKSVLLNKPIALGFSILDLSKYFMFEFHYDKMKKKYGDNIRLLMTDTDSFIYEIKTDDLFQDISENKEWYDLSDISKDHFLHDRTNAKVLGKMKSETGEKIIEEFVGIRSKVYSLLMFDGKNKKTCKGVNKAAAKDKLTHDNYRAAIFENKVMNVPFNQIQSKHHQIQTVAVVKRALCNLDDKRYVCDDGIHTYALGHRKIVV